MNAPLWYAGVCDRMLAKVEGWLKFWPSGMVHSTRTFMHLDGSLEDIPTKRVVMVPWHPREFEHMVRILEVMRPKWELTLDMKNAKEGISKCRLLTGGQRLVPMISYKQDVEEILEVLRAAKDGTATLSEAVEAQKQAGKNLWELD